MKRRYSIIIFIVLVIIVLSCGKSPRKLILGKWYGTDVDSLEFFENGTVKVFDIYWGGTVEYSFSDSKHLRINQTEYEFSISKDTLTLGPEGALTSTYGRKGSEIGNRIKQQRIEKKVIKNMKILCTTVEAISVDHMGWYPTDLSDIEKELPSYFRNPITGKKGLGKAVKRGPADEPGIVGYEVIDVTNKGAKKYRITGYGFNKPIDLTLTPGQ